MTRKEELILLALDFLAKVRTGHPIAEEAANLAKEIRNERKTT